MTKERKQENIVYLGIWVVVFLFPVLSGAYRVVSDSEFAFRMNSIFRTWKAIVPFLILFLFNTYLLAPLLDRRTHRGSYFIIAACSLLLFFAYQHASDRRNYTRFIQPNIERMAQDRREFMERMGQMPHDSSRMLRGDNEAALQMPPFPQPHDTSAMRPMFRQGGGPGPDGRGPNGGGPGGPGSGGGRRDPWWILSPALLQTFIAFLMILANLGIHLFFKDQENEKKMRSLEHENTNQQLQYLRYQINPHFFMNTLNNIHALVDIDPEQAKSCILELSKLMRYVLYEGGKPTIPLEKEIEFLKQYISLMRIRYTDNVKIQETFPQNTSGSEIPPLLFVSFVENAFKHGISYKKDSFINVSMDIEGGRLHFCCENSLNETNEDKHSGIGLDNVKTRMGLLYGDDYILNIDQSEDVYKVTADIPLNSRVSENLS